MFKSEIIFVRILTPLIIGIILGYQFQETYLFQISKVSTIIFFCLLIAVNYLYKHIKLSDFQIILIAWLITVSWFIFGMLISLSNNLQLKKDFLNGSGIHPIKAWVSNEAVLKDGIWRAELNIIGQQKNKKWVSSSGKISIGLKIDTLNPIELTYGDVLLLWVEFSEVEPSHNPGEFDFKAWLAAKNIYHQVFLDQDQIFKLKEKRGNAIISYAIRVRKRQVEFYRKIIHNDEAFAVASTLILGYRSDLSKETLAAYSKTGTIHALSVSGMHVGIIYIFLNWTLFFLDRNRLLKVCKIILICLIMWYYSILTGFSPSVLRSAIMITVFILAKTFNKSSNSYNILSFTAFALLIYDPFLIWDVGFQLSFLAVFGLIYLQPKIYNWLYFKNKWLDKLWSTIALSLAAQITTFPLSVYYFHQFPIYFIFSNLFILLPITLMMYIGIAILLLKIQLLAPIFEWIINFTNQGLKWIAELPFSGLSAIWIDRWELILLCLGLSVFIVALAKYNKSLLCISFIMMIGFQLLIGYHDLQAQYQRKIIFFSLKRNFAIAFIDRKQAILLTDLTSGEKTFEFSVKPALDQLRINKLFFVKWEQDTVINSLIKINNQLVFYGYHLLLADERMNNVKITTSVRFDAVLGHRYFKKSISELASEVNFSMFLIDGTMKDKLIAQHEALANKVGIHVHTLKKKKSYLIELKK